MAETPRAARPPRDNLYRATRDFELRVADGGSAAEGGPGRLVGHFAVFNQWTEINSQVEGRFLERVAPGAFRKTFAENRDGIRVLFNHGKDPSIGDKILGPIDVLEEDSYGARYEVPLLDTSYNRDLAPGLRLKTNGYGSSFRFSVVRDEMPQAKRDASGRYPDYNPEGLPERTIRELRLYEFGPVTFPAYANATASMRSMTDEFTFDRLTEDPARLRELVGYIATTEPAAPSLDAGAEPHLEERRDTPDQPPPHVAAPGPEDPPTGGSPDSEERTTVEYVTIDEKRARDREITDEITRIVNDYTGVLPTDEQARWDNLTAEQDRLRADIAADEARRARLEELAPKPGNTGTIFTPPTVGIIKRMTEEDIYNLNIQAPTVEARNLKLRDNAMRAAEQLRVSGDRYDQDKSRERLQYLLDSVDSEDKEIARRVLTTNSPQYRAAFNRYVKSGGEERGTALAVGVDGTGGYAVPVSFDPTVVAIGAHTAINPYRQSCRVVTIAGTDTWQALTATAITAAYATEAAAATEQGPTFARPEYIAKRAHAFVTASYEMMQDRADLAAELGVLFGEAKDTLEENQFTVGVGTTVYPQGIGLKDAFTRVDSVTNDTTAVADVLAVEAALPIRHRLNAAWYLTRKAIRAIQAWETTGGQLFNGVGYPAVGNPVSRTGGNTGLTLLGYPIWETPSMPWTPTTDDTTWGVLMDPRNYVILDRVGMSIRVIPDMLDGATPSMPTGEVGIYAFWRNTARVLNVDGGRQGAVQ